MPVVKKPPANAVDIRDRGSIPGSGRSPGRGYGNTLQYSCHGECPGQRSLENYSPQGCRVRHRLKQLHTHTRARTHTHRVSIMKGVRYWQINRPKEWNMKSQNRPKYIYRNSVFDKSSTANHWSNINLAKLCCDNWKKINLEKIKWIPYNIHKNKLQMKQWSKWKQ